MVPIDLGPEPELVARLRAGEGAAFEHLVRELGPRLRATLSRLLNDESEADDALQETFLTVFRTITTFEGKARLSTWIHRVGVNVGLMRLRKRRRRREEREDELLPSFVGLGAHAEPVSPWGDLAGDDVERADLCAFVRRTIDSLPDKYRVPLLLHDLEELSNEELANHLGVTVNAAKIRVHRARQALRTLLADSQQVSA